MKPPEFLSELLGCQVVLFHYFREPFPQRRAERDICTCPLTVDTPMRVFLLSFFEKFHFCNEPFLLFFGHHTPPLGCIPEEGNGRGSPPVRVQIKKSKKNLLQIPLWVNFGSLQDSIIREVCKKVCPSFQKNKVGKKYQARLTGDHQEPPLFLPGPGSLPNTPG